MRQRLGELFSARSLAHDFPFSRKEQEDMAGQLVEHLANNGSRSFI